MYDGSHDQPIPGFQFKQGRSEDREPGYEVGRTKGASRLKILHFLMFQQEINLINSDTISAILQSPKCNPVPIKQHDVMIAVMKICFV